ncbi:unnamed protein product [Acanthosepion pharaonis]|uniref:Attractin/MKLN-like beta-propeller domain-containing protein n=1 Tax=Acanthosepion pharaonis TaxID=158019 RepID=A0A812EVH8_ACAPH|nr:unnamed protein product [Sepia pharaonis]
MFFFFMVCIRRHKNLQWFSINLLTTYLSFDGRIKFKSSTVVRDEMHVMSRNYLNMFLYQQPGFIFINCRIGAKGIPTKRAGAAAVAVGNKIVVLGGVSVTQKPLDSVEIYDVETNTWTAGESMRESLLGIPAVVYEDQVLVTGGMSADGNPRNYFMSYNLKTNMWKSLPPMPTERYATFAFLIDNQLYITGGRQGKLPVDAFEKYDFSSKTWEKLPNIPSKRVFALYASNNTHIFSVGGLKQKAEEGFSDTLECYDITENAWIVGPSMPTKRGDFAIGMVDGKLVCAGGFALIRGGIDSIHLSLSLDD